MPALLAIFGFAWFVGWAVMLTRLRDQIDSAGSNKERAKAVAVLFLLWPLEVVADWVAP